MPNGLSGPRNTVCRNRAIKKQRWLQSEGGCCVIQPFSSQMQYESSSLLDLPHMLINMQCMNIQYTVHIAIYIYVYSACLARPNYVIGCNWNFAFDFGRQSTIFVLWRQFFSSLTQRPERRPTGASDDGDSDELTNCLASAPVRAVDSNFSEKCTFRKFFFENVFESKQKQWATALSDMC